MLRTTILGLFFVFSLVGCERSIEDWEEDIDAAYAKVRACEGASQVSDSCANAYLAVRNYEAEQHELARIKAQADGLAEKRAEEETYERDYAAAMLSLESMAYREFSTYRCSKSAECEAYRNIEDSKKNLFLEDLQNRFSWAHVDSQEFKDEYCQGLSKDDFICRMGVELGFYYSAKSAERQNDIKRPYEANRDLLKEDYNRCVDRLDSVDWDNESYTRSVATNWMRQKVKEGDSFWERCHAAFNYAFTDLEMSLGIGMREKI